MREQAAQSAAEAWLRLVDQAEYGSSWEDAASYFKKVVQAEQWETTARGVREPLGAVESRELSSAQYHATLPGAPDGDYVICRYRSSFARKREAIETVTCVLDNDEEWRVSGYFIE